MDAFHPQTYRHRKPRRPRLPALGDQRGFTLVELLSSIATMLIVLLAALAMFEFAVRAQPQVSQRNDAIQTAQVEIERMVRDLRQAYGVVSATPSALTVLTYDNRTTCAGATLGPSRECRVTYTCSAGTCTRASAEANGSSPGAPRTIITGLASDSVFGFTPSAAAPSTILIRLEMPASGTDGEDAVTLEEGVTMRNLAVGGA
jgi:type II secretory pathway pseudopilin PulG